LNKRKKLSEEKQVEKGIRNVLVAVRAVALV